ncbi:MAG: hypothetical protein ABI857_04310 [Acidobacteriota bacterium]
MRKLLIMIALALSPLEVMCQVDERSRQAEKVRNVVEGYGQKPTKVTLLARRIIVAKGKIIRFRDGSFDLKIRRRVVTTVPYDSVLEMSGGGTSLSFVPASSARNYGSWEDVGGVYPNSKILIVRKDGKSVKGFSNSITEDRLIMIDEKGRERVEVPREEILAFYGLVGGYGGVKAGASKGAEGMTTGRDHLLDGIFAGLGALVGLAKSEGRPVLIYSK